MFQNFILRKMLRTKGVPESQIDAFIKIIEKDPRLFKKIGEEVQAKVREGVGQTSASIEVMKKYEEELKKLI